MEVWKAVTDDNIGSSAADKRRESFDMATELKTLADVDVVLDGKIYGFIKVRLDAKHQLVINKIYRLNDATTGLNIGTVQSVNEVAKIEAKINHVIIVGDATSNHKHNHPRIACVTPSEFVSKVKIIEKAAQGPVIQAQLRQIGNKPFYNSGLEQLFFNIR